MAILPERERLLMMLSCVPGVGERTLARLLESGIPLARLFEFPAEELQGRFDLSPRAARSLSGAGERLRVRVAPLERLVARHGIRILVRGSAGYPPRLAAAGDDAPPVLYAYGNPALADRPAVALLSSSGESRTGLERTAALADQFARAGAAVVSGHNRPAYRVAASAAKAAGGCRILVLDRGLLEAFGDDLDRDPVSTARVWGYAFEAESTLALSPYPLDARFAGIRNQRRDCLVALLAHRIVAVEVRPGGVMESECRRARARGPPVLVYAGPDAPDGNGALLAEGFPRLPEEAPLQALMG